MKITYVDAGVLIAAARGKREAARAAMQILDDPERSFASSIFLKLEVLPKAVFNAQVAEAEFYEAFFEEVSHWAQPDAELLDDAFDEAVRTGLSAIDALHVACAASVGADELVTTEAKTRPLHRTTRVKVTGIAPVTAR